MEKKLLKPPTPTTVGLPLAWWLRRGTLAHGNMSCHVLSGSNARGCLSSLSCIIISLNETYLGFES